VICLKVSIFQINMLDIKRIQSKYLCLVLPHVLSEFICYHACSPDCVNNGNCTEWSAIWSKIKRVIIKSQVWFQTKIARHEVQFPLYYIHFEILILNNFVKWKQFFFYERHPLNECPDPPSCTFFKSRNVLPNILYSRFY
jgi:hypothetical protein